MPLFHFMGRDGRNRLGEVRAALPNIAGAYRGAIRFAGRLLSEGTGHIFAGRRWSLVTPDRAGLMLFHFDFSFSQAPAAAVAGW